MKKKLTKQEAEELTQNIRRHVYDKDGKITGYTNLFGDEIDKTLESWQEAELMEKINYLEEVRRYIKKELKNFTGFSCDTIRHIQHLYEEVIEQELDKRAILQNQVGELLEKLEEESK